ncbi:MAG: isoleucine--tRNA ligase [Candidatus Nealsonbacteria bacterium RIFOXYB1_FULL_40_15]|uniref:Isoleucine--tRNA ligase n=2 Tax=Candidatus Nealsoniibacteriota TaxID=1817911 RepID=A0A1G2ETG8_9BACT|nr:MAG: isoleucine--tRNA ligase [Candidatus Nealsonbacteria bacterium RIFOXYB1_FULL_40_15]OGZ28473.1 MAG: isoleucine--tRNA ligase [Candidatus Nealsonbacteria bacterium RIFOXYD1_FULL_39_11]OGZ29084.1 MAG: isoleucine--tRNA ligase [Candidatus Nealsonbacteria bacterium RIFOXYC1_FULL_40_7]
MYNFPETENKILKFWEEKKIFEKLKKKNQGKKRWSFLDGPITANNSMGVHHAWGRTYKDLFQRYKAMQGFDERYQNGFDCQGLWVEVEVEKEKGIKNKKDIELFGIDKFVEACKERVLKYSKIQTEQSIRLGQWMDWDNSYYTMSDENNYTIWNFLKTCHKKKLLYKGHDSVPWCPRCGTAISQHEILTEEYKELVHKSVYVRFKLKEEENTYFLAWTTTPWTLPGNVALAVNPGLEYAKVKKGRETYILLKEKSDLAGGEITEIFKGKKLENLEYEGLFDSFEAVKAAVKDMPHRVIIWKDVTSEDGTGVVHIAPGCGAEDFSLSKELDLPVIDVSDNESNYRPGFGGLTGTFVGSEIAREKVLDLLGEKVFKTEEYAHRYPTCWRCKSELIFRVVDEWYISMKKIRKDLVKTAKKIKWIPSFGLDRELDWLKNMKDWLISKKRYWGLALPIYECECGNFEVIGSKEELKKKAVSGWEEFEGHSPHRPWIDEVKIKCAKCGKEVSRVKDVGNPWLDAGIVPFSTMPEKWFPAELVTESFPGQFKNWFYSLIVMSSVLKGENPMKTVFGFATVKDEKGEEMHKSKGNAIWFDDAVEKIGADPMRWMYAKQNPAIDLKFGYGPAEEAKRKLMTLYNAYEFFRTYVPEKDFPDPKPSSADLLDKWILSRFNSLLKDAEENFDEFDPASAVSRTENFFIEDLSLWYIRRSRKRFHEGAEKREDAIAVLYSILLNLSKAIAPIMPFFAEDAYQSLRKKDMPESVHLCEWPKAEKRMIDEKLEQDMAEIRGIVNSALAKRAEAGIKVRQPLQELRIKNQESGTEEELINLIKEEVNVKEVVFDQKQGEDLMLDLEITEDLKKEGEFRELVRNINSIRKKMGFTPNDLVIIQSDFDIENKEELMREVKAKELVVRDRIEGGEEIKVGSEKRRILLTKTR